MSAQLGHVIPPSHSLTEVLVFFLVLVKNFVFFHYFVIIPLIIFPFLQNADYRYICCCLLAYYTNFPLKVLLPHRGEWVKRCGIPQWLKGGQ